MNNHNGINDMIQNQMTGTDIRIKVIGIGNAGGNVLDGLKLGNFDCINLVYLNTDVRSLSDALVSEKVALGKGLTHGLGAGGETEIGRKAAEADAHEIERIVNGVDLVFIVAGLGGGTGTGAAPVVARIAAESGALVIAFTTIPFSLEGSRKLAVADEGMTELRKICNAVIPLPNDILLQENQESQSVLDSFSKGDEWIAKGIRAICSMVLKPGLIDVDFATLKKVFSNSGGRTLFGFGKGEGENAVDDAIKDLLICPLLHTPDHTKKSDKLMVNITGGTSLNMNNIETILKTTTASFCSRDETVFGAVIDESKKQQVEICVIGTTDIGTKPKLDPIQEDIQTSQSTPAFSIKPIKEEAPESAPINRIKKKIASASSKQWEFEFDEEADQRGYFSKTERNFHEDEDLDIPTYLRRGIHIAL